MPKKSSPTRSPRVPPDEGGIQVNHCKNPNCTNFGVPARPAVPRGAAAHGKRGDGYRIMTSGPGNPMLHCQLCHETIPVKSNLAVTEERERMLRYLRPSEPACPEPNCANHVVPITVPKAYQSFGTTAAGSARYRCKACDLVFSVARKAGLRQRESHKNRMVLALLLNKSPLRRICEVADIAPKTLYQRIGFFQQQCMAFAASRERALMDGMVLSRLDVCVDRQDYMVNWSNQTDRRNVMLHGLGSADNRSGYAFGMHLDFDPAIDRAAVEADAARRGDLAFRYPFRRYARLWLKADYTDSLRQYRRLQKMRNRLSAKGGVIGDIESTYEAAVAREDIEAPTLQTFDTRLPSKGMQLHSEYTLYGHFFSLERVFRGVGKIRFFLDQESGIRAACLAAFKERITGRTVDAFFVRINKILTVNERRRALAASRARFEQARTAHPKLTDRELELLLIQQRVSAMAAFGKWSDRWLLHPFPSMSEPEKAICYLTDFQEYPPEQLARLYQRASLHAIDRFFMQLRRRVNLLERPIQTASSSGRVWYGYSPYNPEMVVKMLDIFRVAYNYVFVGEDRKTPAMRLGLAQAPLKLEDLLYFYPRATRH